MNTHLKELKMINRICQSYISLLKLNSFKSICCLKNASFTSDAADFNILRKNHVKRKIIYNKTGKQFIDWKKLYISGGKGGDGKAAFMNARSHKGGPYGGDGAPGGDVYVMSDENLTHLAHLKNHYRAGKGGNGSTAWKHGKKGKSVTFSVPVGTIIIERDTGEVIADLVDHGQKLLLVNGGEPGLGNEHFKAADFVRPKEFTEGGAGEELHIEIELKSIADIGLVGFPNAGKSTLLNAISRAKPKIANYPFTTLQPNLGVVQYEDGTSIKIADIPGLVEGAHEDKGLGHIFLRHVERCQGLIYVVDVTDTDPLKQFDILKYELEMYKSRLSSLPSLFVANKIDLLEDGSNIVKEIENTVDMPVIGISGKHEYNIDKLKSLILDLH